MHALRVGRIAGTPISVEGGLAVLGLVFVAALAVQGFPRIDPEAGLVARLVVASVAVAAFLVSILAHELGHATVARRQGIGVLGITLSLFGGYAELDRQAPTPWAEFAVAAAGPAANLGIGSVLAVATIAATRLTTLEPLIVGALAWLAGINIVVAVVNLVPAAPLDGGRVLTAALWAMRRDAELARVLSGRAGVLLGVALGGFGAFQVLSGRWEGLIMFAVGAFLFNGARGEIGAATIRRRLRDSTPGDVMVADPPPVSDGLTVEQLHAFAGPERRGVAFPVVRWSSDPVGYVVPAAGGDLATPDRSWTTVSEVMSATPSVSRAWRNEPIDEVLRRQGDGDDLLVVVHEPFGGRVVGTVSAQQLEPLLARPDFWGRDRERSIGHRATADRRAGNGESSTTEQSVDRGGWVS